MAKNSILDRYTKRARSANLDRFTRDSRKWYIDKVSNIQKADHSALVRDPNTKKRDTPMIGRMYTFKYDPKWKDKLPYYDIFPVIFLADIAKQPKGSFYGLNIHYLSPFTRAVFVQRLIDNYITDDLSSLKATTRLKISYGVLKSAAKVRAFRPTFKQYLPSHMRTKLVEIPPDQWETAVYLPVQSFKKDTKTAVWTDSEEMII